VFGHTLMLQQTWPIAMPSSLDQLNFFDFLGAKRSFNPASLFGPSDTGAIYDPFMLTSLSQDNTGATPVTTVGQTVGRTVDQSGKGNHATQATAGSRPTYGRHPVGGRRNLLTWTEDFSNAAWGKIVGGTGILPIVTLNAGADPDGGNTAIRVQLNAGSNGASDYSLLRQTDGSWPSGRRSIYIKSNTGANQTVALVATNNLTKIVATPTWQRLSDAVDAAGPTQFDISVGGTASTPATADVLVWHPQRDIGAITAYQKVTTAFDVTEAGKADCYYLAFDGSDDSLATSAFAWGSDKATIVAAIGKATSHTGIIAEFSPAYEGNTGSHQFYCSAAAEYYAYGRGTAAPGPSQGGLVSGVPAVDTAVISATHNIAGDLTTIRRNGVSGTPAIGDKGAGDFGTYALNIGRRSNTTFPFNGRIYGLFMINRILSADELAAVERFMAARCGVTL